VGLVLWGLVVFLVGGGWLGVFLQEGGGRGVGSVE